MKDRISLLAKIKQYFVSSVLCAHSVKIPKVTFHSSIQISLSVSALFHCHFLHGIDRLGVCMLVIIARSKMRSIWHFVFLTLLALISVAGWEGKSTDIMASISQLCCSSSSIGRCSALGGELHADNDPPSHSCPLIFFEGVAAAPLYAMVFKHKYLILSVKFCAYKKV